MKRLTPLPILLIAFACVINVMAQKLQNELPSFEAKMMDGKTLRIDELTGKVALVLFQPDCDHCQREAQDIKRNLSGFKDYQLYFISSASDKEIASFAKEYGLAGVKNVFFGRTEAPNIVEAFGPIEAPSLYLYSREGKLIHSFNGEVAIEVVLKYI